MVAMQIVHSSKVGAMLHRVMRLCMRCEKIYNGTVEWLGPMFHSCESEREVETSALSANQDPA